MDINEEESDKKIKQLLPIMEVLPSREWVQECIDCLDNKVDNQFLETKKVYATKDELKDQKDEMKYSLESKLLTKATFETFKIETNTEIAAN